MVLNWCIHNPAWAYVLLICETCLAWRFSLLRRKYNLIILQPNLNLYDNSKGYKTTRLIELSQVSVSFILIITIADIYSTYNAILAGKPMQGFDPNFCCNLFVKMLMLLRKLYTKKVENDFVFICLGLFTHRILSWSPPYGVPQDWIGTELSSAWSLNFYLKR